MITKIMLKLCLIFLIYLGAAFFKDWPWTVQYPEPRFIIVCQVSVTDGRGLHMDTMSEIVVVGVKRVRPRMKGVFGFLCWPVKKAAIEKNMVSCTLSKTPHLLLLLWSPTVSIILLPTFFRLSPVFGSPLVPHTQPVRVIIHTVWLHLFCPLVTHTALVKRVQSLSSFTGEIYSHTQASRA